MDTKLSQKTSYYGEAFKTFAGLDRATSNTCIESSGQQVVDSFVPSCSGMILPHDVSPAHLAALPAEPSSATTQQIAHTDLDSDAASCDPAHRHLVVSPGKDATDQTDIPNELSLDDDEWQMVFGQSLSLDYEHWFED